MKAAAPLLLELDRARAAVLARTLRSSALRAIYRDRVLRLQARHGGALVVSSTLAVVAPTILLLVSPLILGVPHLLQGYRYLPQLAPGGASRALRAIFLGGVILGALLHPAAGGAWLLLVAGVAAAWGRSALVLLGVATLALVGGVEGFVRAMILAHNAAAYLFWMAAARTPRGRVGVALAGLSTTAMTVALLTGAFEGVSPFEEAILLFGRAISPTSEAVVVERLARAFAFTQAMHYVVWLVAIPEERHRSAVPLGFRRAARVAAREVGPWALGGVALAGIALALHGAVDVVAARGVYAALAASHAFVELGVLPAALAAAFARTRTA